jgi:hypothetical protein
MRRLLALLAVAGWSASWTHACTACTPYEETPNGNESETDAAPTTDASSSDATVVDGATDARPAFCSTPIASVQATFNDSIVVPGFSTASTNSGILEWASDEGATAKGALRAAIASTGDGQAQMQREIPLGGATRARLTFATKVVSALDTSVTTVGCTLELASPKTADGGDAWTSINFEVVGTKLSFNLDASLDSQGASPFAVTTLPLGEWKTMTLEMTEIGPAGTHYAAFVDGQQVPTPSSVVLLDVPPDHLRLKCGIDSAKDPAIVLTDDLDFVTCVAP